MSGPDIFISYSREDRSAARHFAKCFADAGFGVWWDAALRSGETFDEVIERELRAAKAVVVLWSPRSVASRWVRAEATLADRFNKLVPVIIESCNLPIIFELTHAADLADWTGNDTDTRWQTLIDDLRRLVGPGEEAKAAEDSAEPADVSKPSAASTAVAGASENLRTANDDDAAGVSPTASRDELMAALERLSKTRSAELAKPTAQEQAQAEFFNRSDEFRHQEGDSVHCLQRLDGEEEVTRFVVTAAGLRIGRTPPADIIVSGSGVSRAHCLIELAGDKLRVTDLNSTNGTYIDNKRIERSEILDVGSILRVGSVSFEHDVRKRSELGHLRDAGGFGAASIPSEARLTGSS